MFTKTIVFFMVIITFFCNLFGIIPPAIEGDGYMYYHDIAYGKHERNILDLYIPDNTNGEAGLVLFIHGGAWVAGDKDGYRDMLRYYSSEYGCVAAAINYRYLSYDVSFDDILDDIETSVARIKEIAETKNVKITKMITTGH